MNWFIDGLMGGGALLHQRGSLIAELVLGAVQQDTSLSSRSSAASEKMYRLWAAEKKGFF